jgi:hypothetical protein
MERDFSRLVCLLNKSTTIEYVNFKSQRLLVSRSRELFKKVGVIRSSAHLVALLAKLAVWFVLVTKKPSPQNNSRA